MNNKKINHHFLQEALVKNFANNGFVQWTKYPSDQFGTFHIEKTSKKEQPIVKQLFYSDEIENKMNNLESDGIQVVNKIAKNAQYYNEVSLSRREIIALRFYSLLSGARTNKLRNNIKNRDGDSQFNLMVQKAQIDAKSIQEEMITTILKYWETNKRRLIGDVDIDIDRMKNRSAKNHVILTKLIGISNILNSRLLLFKFNSANLLLTEALNFTEQNKTNQGILLSFMPICRNIGIAFYLDPLPIRNTGLYTQKSEIFQNDVSTRRHKTKYVNWDTMKKKHIEFLKSGKGREKDSIIFWSSKVAKYHDKKDQFIYEVLQENEETAIVCNAMALIHCENSYVIFQNKSDIKKAEEMIKKKKIIRIENYT